MLRFLDRQALGQRPTLATTMFTDRADQFATRLGWEVSVGPDGQERDAYDAEDALYVIWERPDGRHGGSMRFLPTTGRTMTGDHFSHLTGQTRWRGLTIWECTRFCLARDAGPEISARLMLGGFALGQQMGLTHAVGVFDARMTRIYRRLGWPPVVLGTEGTGRDAISAGLWDFHPARMPGLLRRAGVTMETLDYWRDRSFGARRRAA